MIGKRGNGILRPLRRRWPLRQCGMVGLSRSSLSRYFDFYNTERLHSSLGNLTPHEVYFKEQRGSHHSVALPVLAGFSQSPTDELNKAEELVQKAKALDSKNPDAQNMLGYICMLRGDYDCAIQEGKQAVELAPNVSDTHAVLALSQLFVGQYQEAITAGKKAIHIDPNNMVSRVFLTAAYSLNGQEEEARGESKEVLRINPHFSVDQWEKTIPYKREEDRKLIIGTLRKAGLPD